MNIYVLGCLYSKSDVATVLLKGNVANARNFIAIYKCVSSLSSAFQVCVLV